MGSRMKKSIFDEQTSKALKKWHMDVKMKKVGRGGKSPTVTLGGSPTLSMVRASGQSLHRFKTTGHSTRSFVYEDHESSDFETDPLSPTSSTTNLIIGVDPDVLQSDLDEPHHGEETKNEDDFNIG